MLAGDEPFPVRDIGSKVAGVQERRRTDFHMHLLRPGIPQHVHDQGAGGAPDNGIVDEDKPFIPDDISQYAQLQMDS